MSVRIGLALAHDTVRAVVFRRGTLTWAAEAPLDPQARAESIASLLERAPVPRWSRPTVRAAIGPHASQVRLVGGLPDVRDPDLLASVIRSAAGSFFLKDGVPLITTGARPGGSGLAWAAALDRPQVEAIRDACRTRGWRLRCVAPTPVVLPRAVADESFAWRDGDIVQEITRQGMALDTLRTRRASAADAALTPPQPVGELSSIGERAGSFADAAGAAFCGDDEPLALDLSGAEWQSPAERRRAILVPAAVTAVALALLLLSPLASHWAAWQARRSLPAVRPGQWQVIRSSLSQLDRVTGILANIEAFAAKRQRVAVFLGELARALPPGSVVTDLSLDDGQAQVRLLCPDEQAVLAAMRRVPGTASVELADSISHEATPAGDRQQVRVTFRLTSRRGSSSRLAGP